MNYKSSQQLVDPKNVNSGPNTTVANNVKMEETYMNPQSIVDHEIRHRNVHVADWSHEIGDIDLPTGPARYSQPTPPGPAKNNQSRQKNGRRSNHGGKHSDRGRSAQHSSKPRPNGDAPVDPAKFNQRPRQNQKMHVGPPSGPPRNIQPPVPDHARYNQHQPPPHGPVRYDQPPHPSHGPVRYDQPPQKHGRRSYYGGNKNSNNRARSAQHSSKPRSSGDAPNDPAETAAQRPKLNLEGVRQILEERKLLDNPAKPTQERPRLILEDPKKVLEKRKLLEDSEKSTTLPAEPEPGAKSSVFGNAKPIDSSKIYAKYL